MSDTRAPNDLDLLVHTTTVVAAYLGCNPTAVSDLPRIIDHVAGALRALTAPPAPPAPELRPAVSVRASVKPHEIICLEDGKAFKSLKRHLRTHYDLSPEQYREKWGLSADYPMVAPNYSAKRSQLAKDHGLGRKALAN